MKAFLNTHWRKLASGLVLLSVLGIGGAELYASQTSSCCKPGASCCYPGSPCCKGH